MGVVAIANDCIERRAQNSHSEFDQEKRFSGLDGCVAFLLFLEFARLFLA
jgi:hypothetical protein